MVALQTAGTGDQDGGDGCMYADGVDSRAIGRVLLSLPACARCSLSSVACRVSMDVSDAAGVMGLVGYGQDRRWGYRGVCCNQMGHGRCIVGVPSCCR